MHVKQTTGVGATPRKAQNNTQTRQTAQGGPRAPVDKVSLSQAAVELSKTATQEHGTENSESLRQEKLKNLKKNIQNGTYKPNLKNVAMNLIRDDMVPLV